jgi:hypothetical protein
VGTPRPQVTAYLEAFTGQWPRRGRTWPGKQTMTSAYTAAHVTDALLADDQFRALRLGTWLTTHRGSSRLR